MYVTHLPCDECGDTVAVKFANMTVRMRHKAEGGAELLSVRLGVFCPVHNVGKPDTSLLPMEERV